MNEQSFRTEPSVPNLESVLANMEVRARSASCSDERARIYNLAGDLCFDADLRERALAYYGHAIDVYLATKSLDAAVSVCRKIVRLTPEVVRARCTLAWLALSRGLFEEAKRGIAEYASAASNAGQERAAARHLRLMTDVAENQEILESLAEALLEVGDGAGADRAFGAALGHPTAPGDLPQDEEQRWAAVVSMLRGDAPAPVEPALAAVKTEARAEQMAEISAETEVPAEEMPGVRVESRPASPLRDSAREALRRRIRRRRVGQ